MSMNYSAMNFDDIDIQSFIFQSLVLCSVPLSFSQRITKYIENVSITIQNTVQTITFFVTKQCDENEELKKFKKEIGIPAIKQLSKLVEELSAYESECRELENEISRIKLMQKHKQALNVLPVYEYVDINVISSNTTANEFTKYSNIERILYEKNGDEYSMKLRNELQEFINDKKQELIELKLEQNTIRQNLEYNLSEKEKWESANKKLKQMNIQNANEIKELQEVNERLIEDIANRNANVHESKHKKISFLKELKIEHKSLVKNVQMYKYRVQNMKDMYDRYVAENNGDGNQRCV